MPQRVDKAVWLEDVPMVWDEMRKGGINRMDDYQGFVKNVEELSGRWYFHMIEIPALGVRRISDEKEDCYFEFYPGGKAVAHIHGNDYSTFFTIKDNRISFGHAALAAMRLVAEDGILYLKDYLGTTLTFFRQVREKSPES